MNKVVSSRSKSRDILAEFGWYLPGGNGDERIAPRHTAGVPALAQSAGGDGPGPGDGARARVTADDACPARRADRGRAGRSANRGRRRPAWFPERDRRGNR